MQRFIRQEVDKQRLIVAQSLLLGLHKRRGRRLIPPSAWRRGRCQRRGIRLRGQAAPDFGYLRFQRV